MQQRTQGEDLQLQGPDIPGRQTQEPRGPSWAVWQSGEKEEGEGGAGWTDFRRAQQVTLRE